MKIIFAGPSLHGSTRYSLRQEAPDGLSFRPPAAQGDLFRAVEEGADVIGLIDGVYEHVAAIWHKEILYALSQGVRVFGAASLGALRAAECAAFGMEGVGRIFAAYHSGEWVEDADVALLHGPEELDYLPLSEAMANVRATVEDLFLKKLLGKNETAIICDSAEAIFFKDRTWKKILQNASLPESRKEEIHKLIHEGWINQKLFDAEALVDTVKTVEWHRKNRDLGWSFTETNMFHYQFRR